MVDVEDDEEAVERWGNVRFIHILGRKVVGKHTVDVRPTVLRAFPAVRALRRADLASILATISEDNKGETLMGCWWRAIDCGSSRTK